MRWKKVQENTREIRVDRKIRKKRTEMVIQVNHPPSELVLLSVIGANPNLVHSQHVIFS